jgi:hypothetical protein
MAEPCASAVIVQQHGAMSWPAIFLTSSSATLRVVSGKSLAPLDRKNKIKLKSMN